MFTGLVETTGNVTSVTRHTNQYGDCVRLTIDSSHIPDFDCKLGDSVAVNGCCLTVVNIEKRSQIELSFDVSTETLQRTNLGILQPGSLVNLERAMKLGDRLGGHLVSGHVDTTVTILKLQPTSSFALLEIAAPKAYGKYFSEKGSACLDGVSLTINEVSPAGDQVILGFTIIPETLTKTTLGMAQTGAILNLEVDQLAKHVESILRWQDRS